jgi:sortase A
VTGQTLGGEAAPQRLPPARHVLRAAGTAMIVAGVAALAWTIVVWQWQDPFTGLYTRWEQHRLVQRYDGLVRSWHPPPAPAATTAVDVRAEVARDAAAFRRQARPGQAIGRLVVGRIGVNMILVEGTDEASLRKGPGRDARSYMPGQNRLVYIAGHRTTYLAPFAHIDDIRAGDYVRLELPYATFVYRAFRHEIVPATAMSMLRSPDHELLRLQACHPRFFATHRYIVDARLVSFRLPGGRSYSAQGVAQRQP